MKNRKIAIIVQRYGVHINGGAEVHARMVAEKLNEKYDVTVLTSCAINYHTWKPELEAGESFENNIRVLRFTHPQKLSPKKIHKLNRKYRGRLLFQKLYRFLNRPKWYLRFFPDSEINEQDGAKWLEYQGPTTYELIDYLKENKSNYDVFIFFTYLYYPTAVGMLTVADKSLFIPTMHDEPAAYYPIFKKVMAAPKRILFNTTSEMVFSEKLFNIGHVSKRVVAVGIDPVDDKIDSTILNKFKIAGKYILYIGRIDTAKGCDELLSFYINYIEANKDGYTLVLAGKNMIEEKKHPNIIYAGFVSEEEKLQLLKQAEVLIIPSKYESLSLVLLESFACKTAVIVNEACEVLKDHIKKSNGGWLYNNQKEFNDSLLSLNNENTKEKGAQGNKYLIDNYSWQKVMYEFDDAIEFVINANE